MSSKDIASAKTCGIVLFPDMTQLDATAPYEVLCRIPGMNVLLLAIDPSPVPTEHGMRITPDCSLSNSPALDIVLIPGGAGVTETLIDKRYVDFVAGSAAHTQWIVSVCTGALLLGAAGLLQGYRATTHWLSLQFLPAFGAIPVSDERVVVDRNRITGAGVSAGLDLALLLASKLSGEEVAQAIQLGIEYDPAPPFHSGHPRTSPDKIRLMEEMRLKQAIERRKEVVNIASALLVSP